MADLPVDRVLPDKPPFTCVGTDDFGPFQVKRGCGLAKRYGVIFTCLTTRAIHIEIAHSLDTPSFMNALLRQQTIDDEGLLTLMCEVEAIVNSRPITRASDDPNDL